MIEESLPTSAASGADEDDQLLAEAREALADARDALLAERTARADARDDAADAREARLRESLDQGAQRLRELAADADARDRSAELRERAAEAREAAAELRAERGSTSSSAARAIGSSRGRNEKWLTMRRPPGTSTRRSSASVRRGSK